jgi:Holliday junction resolvasome RuvABC endonuclease subunit
MEGPNLNAQDPETLFALGECSGAIKCVLSDCRGIHPEVVPPSLLKKFATSNGLADKDKVLHAVKTNWGQDFGDEDDIADAYVLAKIAWAMKHEKFARRCEADVVYKLLGRDAKRATSTKRRPRLNKTENL